MPVKTAAANSDHCNPSRAAAALDRWRRALADSLAPDAGAVLDEPANRTLMLRVFGAAQRLGDLCLTHPDAASAALTQGPSTVLAQTARDLVALERGVGGPEAMHGAMAPLKNRADIAIALAELSGEWCVAEATAARVDFAERLCETGLRWLTRAAIKRGEISVKDEDELLCGGFIIAGGDFAHEDLSPYGPLDLVIMFDEKLFGGAAARIVDRVFVRIGAEFREAFEGKPGEYPLFNLKTPLGSGVGGAGYAESVSRLQKALDAPETQELKNWFATSRIIAGDRQAGGAFLEEIEPIVWNGGAIQAVNDVDENEKAPAGDVGDLRQPFRRAANLCRLAIGASRPLLRTASITQIFENAARARAISGDSARRLIAGEELAQIAVCRTQMMHGSAAGQIRTDNEKRALAFLCGYSDYEGLKAALDGARKEAENAYARMTRGVRDELEFFTENDETCADSQKLEEIGFLDAVSLCEAVDDWARRTASGANEKRFSEMAPGLLTAFSQTQNPNAAVTLFDAIIANADEPDGPGSETLLACVREDARERDAIVDALGCFGAAVAPLTQSPLGVSALVERAKDGAYPEKGADWLTRFPPPAITDKTSLEEIAAWRRDLIAQIAYAAAARAIPFDSAVNALGAQLIRTLSEVFELARIQANAQWREAAQGVCLHIYDNASAYLPGAPVCLGFIAEKDFGEEGEAFVRSFIDMVSALGDGVFAITADVSCRPGGAMGVLAPTLTAFKSFVQSEAVASDYLMLARARVIAGADAICKKATQALRKAVCGARRADVLFRDLDRARAQRMRRSGAASEWDLERIEGGPGDVELIISTLIYKHGGAHPFVQDANIAEALEGMARSELIDDQTARALAGAHAFWARLQAVRALSAWTDPVRMPVKARFGALIAQAAGVSEFDQVRPLMRGYANDVARLYAQLVLGRPAISLTQQSA